MNAKRLVTALIVALLVSGLFTLWLSKRMATTSHTPRPSKQVYVAAARALQAGELLRPENLEMVEWPTSVGLVGGFAKLSDVAGRTVLYPLAKDEPILDRHLAAPGAGVGLTANIPPGMRAISVRSDEVVGVAGFLLPGTHVDMLVTYRSDKVPDPLTATVLQDVEILATGQQMHPDPEGKPTTVNVVTLLLKPEDAERVVLATSLGAIHFVLRNGSDRETTSNPPVGLSQLARAAAPVINPQARPSLPKVVHPKPRSYEVETILGDKQILSKFN